MISYSIVDHELGRAQVSTSDVSPDAQPQDLSLLVETLVKAAFADAPSGIPQQLYQTVLHRMEKPLISTTLAHTGGNQIKAADILGLNRNTLRKKIKELDIKILKTV